MERLLPVDIIFNIFYRLPAESVLLCSQVCKTWRNLIRLPYFADTHLRFRRKLLQLEDDHSHFNLDASNFNGAANKVGGLGILFAIQFSDKDKGNVGLYYGEYDENNIDKKFSYRTLTKINIPPINEQKTPHSMVGSCNGLICFSMPYMYHTHEHGFYICNPITREYKRLYEISKCEPMVYGFGYIPSCNEYKIVRICDCGRIQVYTIGSGNGWRNKEKITCKLGSPSYPPPPGILANGALHWLDHMAPMKILAFDLADEKFRVVPSPPCFLPAGYNQSKHHFQLQELGRCLCLVHHVKGERMDIWSLKKMKNSTNDNMEDQEYQLWTWSREFSIRCNGWILGEYKPFALTKSGEVLFWRDNKILFRYDPKTGTLKKLSVEDWDLKFFQAIPHMNSFVSMKALGEKSRKRKQYMRR
ncbi:F-box domain [Macleaya cordata]|uniref:F-box domain n=1 Tax=Macleaya cordata TaxID=56857 RepID=A0A200QFE3_MACCD|nr:F-box domain [Macleaya cordata]